MAYKQIKFGDIDKRAGRVAKTIAATEKIINGSDQVAAQKAEQVRTQIEESRRAVLAGYTAIVKDAIENNLNYAKEVDSLHQTGKQTLAQMQSIVDRVDKGGEATPKDAKLVEKWSRALGQVTQMAKKEGKDLMSAMAEFRGNAWKKALGALDKDTLGKLEAARKKTIDKNNMAAAKVKRIGEYVTRADVLTKSFASMQSDAASSSQALARSVAALDKEISSSASNIIGKIDTSSAPIQKMMHKLRRAKTHADAVKVEPTYETVIGQVLGRWPALVKNSKGSHKTLTIKLTALEKQIGDANMQKAFKSELASMKKCLEELKGACDVLGKESAATEKRYKELIKSKKK